MISIGTIFEGPELKESAIDSALRRLGKAAIDVRGDLELGEHPAVNVVFHVPGSLGRPLNDWRIQFRSATPGGEKRHHGSAGRLRLFDDFNPARSP